MNSSMSGKTDESTLEKSADGDMTKLSLLFDHDIRLEILGSSSILITLSAHKAPSESLRQPTCIACV